MKSDLRKMDNSGRLLITLRVVYILAEVIMGFRKVKGAGEAVWN
jgi:hypothetical protein